MVLEKTLESPLDYKEIQPVHPKGNKSWMFIGRTDAEAETPILWPPDVKNRLIRKGPDAGKDWRWEEKETTEDEMVGWHHQGNGQEFEQALGIGDGQGSLACCSPWGHRVGHNWENELSFSLRLQYEYLESRRWVPFTFDSPVSIITGRISITNYWNENILWGSRANSLRKSIWEVILKLWTVWLHSLPKKENTKVV